MEEPQRIPQSRAVAAPPDRETGEAAEAIAHAEAALAHQNSVSSQLDMQVITAILNAHLNAVEGREALAKLQQDTEAAVRTRSDLDTPAGARDFQRFLIGKLRDIRAVVLNASLDDTSKSALMAAWTSLYDASKGQPDGPDERLSAQTVGADADTAEDSGWDPLLDSLLAEDPGLASEDMPGVGMTDGAPAPAPSMAPAAVPPIPSFAPGLPSLGAMPGGLPPPGVPGGDAMDPALQALDDEGLLDSAEADPETDASSDEPGERDGDEGTDAATAEAPSASGGPTTVTLPDGETVTAASPQLAAAIKGAVGGAAIPDAFQQQGITIPPPGTAVPEPIDPAHVVPADIGMFVDRHALALGPGKALLDGQIQDIATVSGPSFLGWEHPPAAAATAPAKPEPPTPTRPATSSTT
ncbi:DUF4226 domain-containing protein [Mycobacterium malmoense]|uniref:DUF4226 domain-containing protein n=1 Tax=Mycobacterium malmoense TaxID=1780 RepID=UPI000AAC8BC5|nr:DUF4226 domain-containing protein [Mycobacterium malmoense]